MDNTLNPVDNRKFLRVDTHIPAIMVSALDTDPLKNSKHCKIKNISLGGALVFIDKKLGKINTSKIQLSFFIPKQEDENTMNLIMTEGAVLRIEKQEETANGYNIGIKFSAIEDWCYDKFSSFIDRKYNLSAITKETAEISN